MPLPPLPFNNTDIAWLKYTSAGVEHELMFRQPFDTTQADIIANAVAMATTLKTIMPTTDAFIGLRHQDKNSNLSFPLAWSAIAGTRADSYEVDDKPKFFSRTGRSLGGYRSRITFFSPFALDSVGYRVPVSTAGFSQTFAAAIDDMEPAQVAVDGNLVVWNNYVNIGYNAYWQRQQRKG